jgi:ABC-type phosphate/phosphonate transport system substrate-binding protein
MEALPAAQAPGGQVVPICVAALPMYDFPELRAAHDRIWAALACRLRESDIVGVPRQLMRRLTCREVWRHPGLLFGQACEYPVSKSFRGHLRVLATPRYRAPGCDKNTYRSAIVVRVEEPANALYELHERRCVVNEPDSNSGMNLLRAALAPLAGGVRFFHSVSFSGSHLRSVELIAAGEADVAAIDCVTLEHLRRARPQLISQVRILDWTPASPCLPFVISRQMSEATVAVVRSALNAVCADPALAPVRDTLLLDGVDLLPDTTFGRVLELEQRAVRWRYPALL